MERPPSRPSNVSALMRPGRYRYVARKGAKPQLVDVTYELGHAVARFLEGPQADQEQLVRQMAGKFERAG
jgi:hypothetical protein